MSSFFEVLGDLLSVETIATANGIREIKRLRRVHGSGRWRKRKGVARIKLMDGSVHLVIDESGEDYLYPSALFRSIELTNPLKRVLLAA